MRGWRCQQNRRGQKDGGGGHVTCRPQHATDSRACVFGVVRNAGSPRADGWPAPADDDETREWQLQPAVLLTAMSQIERHRAWCVRACGAYRRRVACKQESLVCTRPGRTHTRQRVPCPRVGTKCLAHTTRQTPNVAKLPVSRSALWQHGAIRMKQDECDVLLLRVVSRLRAAGRLVVCTVTCSVSSTCQYQM